MVIAAVFLIALCAAVVYSVSLLRRGLLDAQELAAKLSVPRPTSVCDWPELRIEAVVPSPASPSEIMLVVAWPRRSGVRVVLVLDTEAGDRSEAILAAWCRAGTSISPMRSGKDGLVLRPRGGRQRLRMRILSEDYEPVRL